MAQDLHAAPLVRDNDPLTVFAKEAPTKRSKTVKKSITVLDPEPTTEQQEQQPNGVPAQQASDDSQTTPETPETQAHPQQALSKTEERAALKAQGLKRCPSHARLFDRLPDASRQPVDGQTDPSIRPLSEFGKGASYSTCVACDKLIQKDWRDAHKGDSARSPDTLAKKQALLDKLYSQYNALAARITDLEFEIRQAKEQEQQPNA